MRNSVNEAQSDTVKTLSKLQKSPENYISPTVVQVNPGGMTEGQVQQLFQHFVQTSNGNPHVIEKLIDEAISKYNPGNIQANGAILYSAETQIQRQIKDRTIFTNRYAISRMFDFLERGHWATN